MGGTGAPWVNPGGGGAAGEASTFVSVHAELDRARERLLAATAEAREMRAEIARCVRQVAAMEGAVPIPGAGADGKRALPAPVWCLSIREYCGLPDLTR